MKNQKIPITVVIPVKNEQANLAKCLERLTSFEEVVVLDSNSSDDTMSIAASYGASCLNFNWDGGYPKKRNWYLLNFRPKCDWVLFLDADEFVTEQFMAAAETAVKDLTFNGYWLNYTNYFLGRKLRFGVPQRKLALIRFGAALFERIEEDSWSNLDMEIHEHPVVSGKVGRIRVSIEHNDDRGIEKFVRRHVDYAKWEVARYRMLNTGQGDKNLNLTVRQKIKYKLFGSPLFPICYFVYQLVFKLGILDGHAGFQYAFHKFWYFNLINLLSRSKT